MSLNNKQVRKIVEILIPYVDIPDEARRALIQQAFPDQIFVEAISYSGQAEIFALNCISRLIKEEDGVALAIQLLMTLRDEYAALEDHSRIQKIISEIEAGAIETNQLAESPHNNKLNPGFTRHLFISYSRRDLAFVQRLQQDLTKYDVHYWIDRNSLPIGTRNWERNIRAAIKSSDGVLWIVSPDAYESEYVSSEVAVGEMYARKIFPIWAAGDNWIACVPLGRHNVQYVDMRGELYRQGLIQLLEALGKVNLLTDSSEEEAHQSSLNREPRNPYKGLVAFTEADTGDFYGRDELVRTYALRIQNQLQTGSERFLAVLGASGAGKSSIVKAGLIPELKKGELIPGSESWLHLPSIVPGQHPMEHLAMTLASVAPEIDAKTILLNLYISGFEYLDSFLKTFNTGHVVLYIDQFEELFVLAEDDTERQHFINLLTDASSTKNGRLIMLLSMRVDYLHHPISYPPLGALFEKQSVYVHPMNISELRDAILKPAQQPDVQLEFDEDLIADIVFALRDEHKALEGALPLLQFTMERLFLERKGKRLTREAYISIGGVNGAISVHCEKVFASLPETVQNELATVFLPLVNIDTVTGEPTRRRAEIDDLALNPDAMRLMNELLENRLLQSGREGDIAYIEVAHEALLRNWSRLVQWIASTRDDLRLLRQVEDEARNWDANGRTYLPSPARLQPVHAAITRLDYRLNRITRDYVFPQAMLIEILDKPDTGEQHRLRIGDDLALLGDPRSGISLNEDGTPDVMWLPVTTPVSPVTFQTNTNEIESVQLFPYCIAKYHITFLQFQAFIEADDGFNRAEWWQDFSENYQFQKLPEQRTKLSNNPRDNVSWYHAIAFARWMNYRLHGLEIVHPQATLRIGDNAVIRLPAEWEWQWAAQAGAETRTYPWGDWQPGYANTTESGLGRSIAVGMYPQGVAACGALDMAGNLWEWCLNEHDDHLIVDGFQNQNKKVLRGGFWLGYSEYAEASFRYGVVPEDALDTFGIRLVLASPIN